MRINELDTVRRISSSSGAAYAHYGGDTVRPIISATAANMTESHDTALLRRRRSTTQKLSTVFRALSALPNMGQEKHMGAIASVSHMSIAQSGLWLLCLWRLRPQRGLGHSALHWLSTQNPCVPAEVRRPRPCGPRGLGLRPAYRFGFVRAGTRSAGGYSSVRFRSLGAAPGSSLMRRGGVGHPRIRIKIWFRQGRKLLVIEMLWRPCACARRCGRAGTAILVSRARTL